MKYDVALLLEVVMHPNDATVVGTPEKTGQELAGYLADGYELYKVIPLTTVGTALIKYILRRERKV